MLSDLVEPRWWFTAVFVAILVNLISSYLNRPIERLSHYFSEWVRHQSKRSSQRWQTRLNLAKASDRALLVETAREARYRAAATFHSLLAFAFLAATLYLDAVAFSTPKLTRAFVIVTLVFVVAALVNTIRAADVHDLVLRAVERSLAAQERGTAVGKGRDEGNQED